jgi:hypothetical protein
MQHTVGKADTASRQASSPGSSLPVDDALWKVLSYNSSLKTASTSIIPSIAAMSAEDITAAIELNRQRLGFIGVQPQACAAKPSHINTAGSWSIVFGKTSRERAFMQIVGAQKQASLVSVFVDGLLLNSRHLPKHFRISITSIKRLKPFQTIFVANPTGLLTLNGQFTHYSGPKFKKTRAFTDLKSKILSGKYLNKKNRMQPLYFAEEASQLAFFEGYRVLQECFLRVTGYELFLSHGTLLGMIRDGKLVPSDDDFDCAYFSKHTNSTDAFYELFKLGDVLKNNGVRVRFGTSGHLKASINDCEYDIMPTWCDHKHFCVSSYSAVPMRPTDVLPLINHDYHGLPYLTIAAPQRFLELNYGPHWRTPDPFYRSVRSPVARANQAEFLRIQSKLSIERAQAP